MFKFLREGGLQPPPPPVPMCLLIDWVQPDSRFCTNATKEKSILPCEFGLQVEIETQKLRSRVEIRCSKVKNTIFFINTFLGYYILHICCQNFIIFMIINNYFMLFALNLKASYEFG